ncbi:MAG: hypothetical protein NTY75_00740 [Candidatus Shapirobacteria bacterium]|nr:hypothetical protein [Candidatus Shapirobacteria bacterium]
MFLLPLILAATITVTPPPTGGPPSPTPKNFDEIQKVRDVVQQKVMEKLQQITQPALTQKGIIGKIIQIDSATFTLEFQNNLSVVTFNTDTVFIDQKRNKITVSQLKVGQDILVLGIQQSSSIFLGKRIVVTDLTAIENVPLVVIGKIVDISKTSPVFSLIPTKNKNAQYQVKTDVKSEIINTQSNKIATTDLKSGHKIIVILTPDPKMAKTYYAAKIVDLDYALPTPTPTKKP